MRVELGKSLPVEPKRYIMSGSTVDGREYKTQRHHQPILRRTSLEIALMVLEDYDMLEEADTLRERAHK